MEKTGSHSPRNNAGMGADVRQTHISCFFKADVAGGGGRNLSLVVLAVQEGVEEASMVPSCSLLAALPKQCLFF